MNYIEFVVGMKKRYANKDLNDEQIIDEVNHYIYKYLKDNTKGELLENIYRGILEGKTQADIARENNVNSSLVADYLVKIRRLIAALNSAGIKLEQFKKFESRPYKFKEETLMKKGEQFGIKRNRK